MTEKRLILIPGKALTKPSGQRSQPESVRLIPLKMAFTEREPDLKTCTSLLFRLSCADKE